LEKSQIPKTRVQTYPYGLHLQVKFIAVAMYTNNVDRNLSFLRTICFTQFLLTRTPNEAGEERTTVQIKVFLENWKHFPSIFNKILHYSQLLPT
jgi:hypothetical protein